MPFHARSIAMNCAVLCFFFVSMVGWISGLTPFTCCKRALIGAFLAYIAANLAVKVINAIIINAIVASQIKKQKENAGTDGN